MDIPSLSPTSQRLRDRVLEIIGDHPTRTMRTEEVIAKLSDAKPVNVRQALSRLGRTGELTQVIFGVWSINAQPRAARPPVPRQEIVIPGATSDDLLMWASNTEENNPVTTGAGPFRPSVDLTITDRPFMGVELTFIAGDKPIFAIALFADIPTEEEREIMEQESITAGGL